MLKIIAASSLYNSIGELQIKLRKQLRELVHAGPGFSLNPESVNKSKDLYNYLKSEELRDTRIILWHALINNTITPHISNNYPVTLTTKVTRHFGIRSSSAFASLKSASNSQLSHASIRL